MPTRLTNEILTAAILGFEAQKRHIDSKTQLTRLMRIAWETVGNIVARVVAEKLPAGRLDALELIGCDEVNYGAEHKFLTCVANHETGAIVWATEGRNAAS